MSQQQRLARHILSVSLSRSFRPCILPQESQRWLQRRTTILHYSSSSSSPAAPAALPTSIVKNVKTDTRRRVDNPGLRSRQRSQRENVSALPTVYGDTTYGRRARSDRKWEKSEDEEIVRLFNDREPWKKIDEALGRPLSSCYARYYMYLDPYLRTAWTLPNGQSNDALLKRLVYLADVEKQSFAQIEALQLMKEPWTTPTPYAPPELLAAAAQAGIKTPPPPPVKRLQNHKNDSEKASDIGPFNKIGLQKKYLDYKSLLNRNAIRVNNILLHRAIRRSVELYGENWKKVASNADMLLDQWTDSRAATDYVVPSEEHVEGIYEREPLTPNRVASVYRILERRGIDWGIEDDVIMARKVLELSRTQPDIMDILSKPVQDLVREPQTEERQDQDSQEKYWTEISIALGNHSPAQCKRRWDGLWSLQDDDKSTRSKSFHRFERFQFWMLWRHFYQQYHQGHNDLSLLDPGSEQLKSIKDLDEACSKLSFAKDISRWMRHRTEAVCRNFFRLTVNSALHLCIPTNANTPQPHRQKQKPGKVQSKEEGIKDQESTGKELAPTTPKYTTVSSLLDSILSQVAEPMLEKMTTISTENELSSRYDPQQQIVRSEWTRDRIQMLQEIVMQEKQGVERADFELDWDRIARRLEGKLTGPAAIRSATESNITEPTEINPSTVVDVQHQERHPYITATQCQSCWEYISSPAASSTFADLSAASVNAIDVRKLTRMRARESEGKDGGDDHNDLQDWTDHELQLLQQGVRKYGNAWTDVRAQFLPNKKVTDLHQTWQSISAAAEDKPASRVRAVGEDGSDFSKSKDDRSRRAQVDRLAEPDYASLLSALDKIGGKTGGDGSREGAGDDTDKRQ